MLSGSKYIKEVSFSSLFNWSVQYLSETKISFNSSYPLVKIGGFLKRNKTSVTIEDGVNYKRVTIKVRNGGVVQRDTEIGNNIGTKKQYRVSEGQFILSKIDARNGAMGLIPAELEGAIVTQDFLPYDIDTSKVNPQYLVLVSTTAEFVAFCQTCSSGTTNRQRVDEAKFLDIKIPLPTIEEQNELVAEYNNKITLAENQLAQATSKEAEIESYILNNLGVRVCDVVETPSILKFFSYSDISDRWDLLATHNSIFESLKKSKYPLVKLCDAYDFVSRSWKKNASGDDIKFKYIEIGAVDEVNGIEYATELSVSKAPSRATQTVKAGELIIGTTRPYLKKFAIVDNQFDGDVCSSGFQIIGSQKNNLVFLNEYLKSEAGILQFKFYMTGALYPAITSKDLRKIVIPLPPLEVQNEIATHIQALKEQIKQLRTAAEANRQAALTNFEQKIF